MQNYVLADLVAAQILKAVRERFGEDWLENPAVGPFLASTLWKDGETREWTDRVRDATGADLSADAYLALLGIDK
jgi:Zn-dependent M32 family carboxypeptidase